MDNLRAAVVAAALLRSRRRGRIGKADESGEGELGVDHCEVG